MAFELAINERLGKKFMVESRVEISLMHIGSNWFTGDQKTNKIAEQLGKIFTKSRTTFSLINKELDEQLRSIFHTHVENTYNHL